MPKPGPDVAKMRLGRVVAQRRRRVKLTRHGVKGSKPIYWCPYCSRYSYDLQVHICRERVAL